MSRTLIAAAVAAATLGVTSTASADINLNTAIDAGGARVAQYVADVRDSDERGAWKVTKCHTLDAEEVTCNYHVRLTRRGRTTFHKDGTVVVTVRDGRYVAKLR